MPAEAVAPAKRRDRRAYNRHYSQTHRERLREYGRAYALAHRERLNARRRELHHQRHREKKLIRYQKNRERLLAQKRDYYLRNRAKIADYRKANKETISRRNSEWHVRNRERCRRRKRVTGRRLRLDPLKRLVGNLRRRLGKVVKQQQVSKAAHTLEFLGCSVEEFRSHIESRFQRGMTWTNHGVHGWHLDHVVPCSAFDFSDPRQQRQCFHFTNLRPMWARQNLRKSNKIEDGQLHLLL